MTNDILEKRIAKLESLITNESHGRKFEQRNVLLANKINNVYTKLLEAADTLYDIHESITDEELSDNAYDLYLEAKELAESVSDKLRPLI